MSDAITQPAAPPFPTLRAVGVLVGVTLAGGGAAVGGLLASGLDMAARHAGVTGAACGAASLLALIPIHRASRGRGGDRVQGVVMAGLAGVVVRLGVSLAVVAAAGFIFSLSSRPAALWALGWYLLLLVIEVTLLVRYFHTLPGYHPPPRPATDAAADDAIQPSETSPC